MKQHKLQPLNDDEISEILDKHGFNEVQIAGEYIDIVKLIRNVEKTHGIKPQPKEQQYLYAFLLEVGTEQGQIVFGLDDSHIEGFNYIGKIKLEVEE